MWWRKTRWDEWIYRNHQIAWILSEHLSKQRSLSVAYTGINSKSENDLLIFRNNLRNNLHSVYHTTHINTAKHARLFVANLLSQLLHCTSKLYQHSKNTNNCVSLCMLQVVRVTFNELNLEHHNSCRYDSVSLYDGSSANSSSLGRFCTVPRSTITSSGSSLFVVFQTDKRINEGRFSLNWTFIYECEGWFITDIFLDLLQIGTVIIHGQFSSTLTLKRCG